MRLLILSLLLSTSAMSQVTIGIGAGVSKHPIAELNAGVLLRETLLIDIGLQSMISKRSNAVTQFQWRIGYQINGSVLLTPYTGMSLHYVSSDNRSLNTVKPLFGLEIGKPFTYETGRLYMNTSLSGKVVVVSAGVRYLFN